MGDHTPSFPVVLIKAVKRKLNLKIAIKECEKLRHVIKPGVQFADGGIMPAYRGPWKKFMENIVLNQANFLNKYSKNRKINSIFLILLLGMALKNID